MLSRHWMVTVANMFVPGVCLVLSTGCMSRRAFFDNYIEGNVPFQFHAGIKLGGPDIHARDVYSNNLQEIHCGDVIVLHPDDIDPNRAGELAQLCNEMLHTCAVHLDMELMDLQIILFRSEKEQVGNLTSLPLFRGDSALMLPIPETPAIRKSGWLSSHLGRRLLFCIIHEVVESTLVSSAFEPLILPDVRQPIWWGTLSLERSSYTRWFRDGLANYGAYVALTSTACSDFTNSWPSYWSLFNRPLSSLKTVAVDLFDWHQFDDEGKPYYEAAWGFFILIEEQYGADAIQRIIDAAAEIDYPDNTGLQAAVEKVIGITPQQLIASFIDLFQLPDWSLGSLNDVLTIWKNSKITMQICRIEGEVPRTYIDFERLWLRAQLQHREPELELTPFQSEAE